MTNYPNQQYPQNNSGTAQDDGFAKVGGGSGPRDPEKDGGKWYFEQNPIFEGILLRKTLGFKGQYGTSDFFICQSAIDQKEYLISGSTVLTDRMKQIVDGSYIRIVYLGIPPGKRYKAFDVFVNTNYKPTSMVAGYTPVGAQNPPPPSASMPQGFPQHPPMPQGFPQPQMPQGFPQAPSAPAMPQGFPQQPQMPPIPQGFPQPQQAQQQQQGFSDGTPAKGYTSTPF